MDARGTRRFILLSPAKKLVLAVPVGAVLLASPVSAHAAPTAAKVKLRTGLSTISSPPSSAAPGASFTLTGQVTNATAQDAQRDDQGHAAPHEDRQGDDGRHAPRCASSARKTRHLQGQGQAARHRWRQATYYVRGCATFSGAEGVLSIHHASSAGQEAGRRAHRRHRADAGADPAPRRPRRPSVQGPRLHQPDDAITRAGIAAIQAVADASSGDSKFTVDAPADARSMFIDAHARQLPRRGLPRHGREQRADRRPARRVRALLRAAAVASSASARRSRPTRAGSS